MDKCIACGTCAEKCPKKVNDNFNERLGKRKAIYVPYSQAVPLKYIIDRENCIYFEKGRCRACEKFCPKEAVNFNDQEKNITLKVGSVILAPGFETFDPSPLDTYSYSRFPNVITALELERILSATGPYQGHLVRPSDSAEPKKIAWLQCIGSRDINRCDMPYCSSVCCMYAIKEAVIAKEHAGMGLETTIFFMDIRTYGKDFEKYYDRARDEKGVRFVRTRIHTIEEDKDTNNLVLRYSDENGKIQIETFDMVVLSVGMKISRQTADLARRLGAELDQDNFVKTGGFAPVETSRKGIYVCGAFQEPKDIPYSVMEASAAACEAKVNLPGGPSDRAKVKVYPDEKELRLETPRIGVFVCNCGINIGGIVDVPKVAEYAKTIPGVAYVEENLFTCSQDTQEKMKEVIESEKLNRIVVAACTPRTHEALFQDTLRDAGMNKYLFEMANIRNQCSWVHAQDKAAATEKAKDLIRMAVARARLIRPLPQPSIPVDNKALVIGGGISGMTAALGLADQGYHTYLVEQTDSLGGNARRLLKTWRGEDIADHLEDMIQSVGNHPDIEVFTGTKITTAEGFVGNFETTISQNGNDMVLKHGAIVVATGGKEYEPSEYLYGQDPKVLTHLMLDDAIRQNDGTIVGTETAVFIQCVGSREPERPYCSKICCTHTMKSAIRLKQNNPDMNIYVLYRDIRTYGQRETLYKEARKLGIIFIRYQRDQKPKIEKDDDGLCLTVNDPVLGRDLMIRPDLLVLATGIVPYDQTDLAQLYKLSLNEDGFFMEAHAKLRPVDFVTEGIFMAGLSHYPKPIEESIAQAKAAAARASVILSKKEITVEGVVSHVDEAMCRGCGECVEACPFGAISLEELESGRKVAVSREALCKGCGACAVACPTGAASIFHYGDEAVLTMVETALS